MQNGAGQGPASITKNCERLCALALTMSMGVLASGCLSPYAKHAQAFSAATNTVIDSSEDAYRGANKLRVDEQVAAAVYDYDKNPAWSPYKDFKPLLTPEQLDARIKVLDGLKAYAASLVELTGKPAGAEEAALEDAAQGIGDNLLSLNQNIATSFSTAIPNAPVMSTSQANAVSTAVLALADYLRARKVKGSLPKVTQDMNPHIEALCKLLDNDIQILRRQADVDYQTLATNLDQSIRHEGTSNSPYERRQEVGSLIQIAQQQKANDELLEKLQNALRSLALTHQALAAAFQGNNPESIQAKIADLEATGHDLGTFYKSLPTD
jgi:hypothetical protein